MNDIDDTSYEFVDIEDVSYWGADALLHNRNPSEFKAAWDAALKQKVKAVKKIKGSGP